MVEFFVNIPMPGIEPAVTDHFKVLFGDMSDQAIYEFHDRDGFFHINIVFMTVIVEGNKVPIVLVDTGCCNNGSAKVTADIFGNDFGIAFIRFGIDIKTMFMLFIAGSLYFFEGRTKIR